MTSKTYNILVSGGGTGGHFYPAMAIAEALEKQLKCQDPSAQIRFHYMGSRFGMEKKLLKSYTMNSTLLPIRGFLRYISFFALSQNIRFPFRILRSLHLARRVFKNFKPDAVIASGGYACGIPGWLAGRKHIPLFIQEQNAFPGITTRSLAAKASCVYYAYEDVLKHFHISAEKTLQAGNPVRKNIRTLDRHEACKVFGLDPERRILFIFGGSQGALNVNRHIAEHAAKWVKNYNCQILWQTGERSREFLQKDLGHIKDIHLHSYIYDMSSAYSAADLVISRAGALTLAEIQLTARPAILIPLPTAAGNHQYHNALALQKLGAALIVEEKDFAENGVSSSLKTLLDDPEKLAVMSASHPREAKPAADTIAENIMSHLLNETDRGRHAE